MEPLSPEAARERLRAVTRGRYRPRRHLSLEEAKQRLRAVDADLDIGPALSAMAQGRWREAGLSVGLWFATTEGRAFIAPVLLRLLPLVSGLLQRFHSRRPRDASTDEPEHPA